MKRRQFLQWTGLTFAAGAVGACAPRVDTGRAGSPQPTDAEAFRAARRFAHLPFGDIAYVERGSGEAALFLHGAPLNGFQWRGAIARLSPYRRCVVPDFMGLGYSRVPEHQSLAASAQADMLAALLDALAISTVDIVASDSGGMTAQLFMVRHPERVRTLLLTDCDTEPNSPPPKVKPAIEMARAGTLADATAQWLTDKALARSTFGAAVFREPSRFADETIEYYAAPLVSSPLRRAQYHAFHLSLEPNPLAGIEAELKRSRTPVRMVWGASDDIFPPADAHYLDRTLPHSQGIRFVPGAKLFFPEEFPEIIAGEAQRLWRVA
ncbi:alpha/beta fold hydrolase [Corallococcus llansteffanensis]|uniref:Alpha/beta hydrolase n=1 Tax=Corallococcus llansteffanensis TaxID=2316731 RepID=A0A3A8PUH1_9BACT|nr:alpha/beta hydrolase [Corallococcus llansteffanensis]RKH59608.1 alpha/beta hydrolase [Corallococcus llansteffanensis]